MTNTERRATQRRKRRRQVRLLRGMLAVAAIAILVLVVRLIQIMNPSEIQEGEAPDSIGAIPVHTQYIPEGYAGRPGTLREIRTIVIHETANTAKGTDSENHSRYLLNEAKSTKISWHYTVDDHQIYHHLPDQEVGYHAGTAEGNEEGIGVEICVNEDGDFERALDNAAQLTAYLVKQYHLSLDDVYQHHDYSGKDCPHCIREEGRWDAFLEAVQHYMDTISS